MFDSLTPEETLYYYAKVHCPPTPLLLILFPQAFGLYSFSVSAARSAISRVRVPRAVAEACANS